MCASVPRRLAFVCGEPDKSDRQFATSFGPYCKTGVFNKSDQMSAYSRAVHSVSRSSTKLPKYDSFSHRDQGPKDFDHVNQNKNRQISELPHVVTACRCAGRSDACGQVGHAEPKTLPTMADWETSVSQTQKYTLVNVTYAAQQGVSYAGGCYGSTACEKGSSYNRCQSARLGRGLATNGFEGNLGKKDCVPTHQLPRTESSVPNTNSFLEPIDSQTCVDTIRQRVGCIQYKSSGRYKVTKTPPGCAQTLGLGRHPSVFSESSTHTRAHEQVSRRVVTKRAPGRGMATPSRDSAINLEHIRRGRRGSVREDSVSAMSEMVFAVQGSGIARAGCDGPQLAEWSPIRIPSIPDNLVSSQSHSSNESAVIINSPLLAEQAVVSAPSPSFNGSASPVADQTRSPDTVERQSTVRSTSDSEIVHLAIGGDSSLLVCSQGVQNTVLNACAPSTRALYQNRWKLFLRWCNDHQLNHQRCSISDILEFLQSLLTMGRSYSTIRVAAIALLESINWWLLF